MVLIALARERARRLAAGLIAVIAPNVPPVALVSGLGPNGVGMVRALMAPAATGRALSSPAAAVAAVNGDPAGPRGVPAAGPHSRSVGLSGGPSAVIGIVSLSSSP